MKAISLTAGSESESDMKKGTVEERCFQLTVDTAHRRGGKTDRITRVRVQFKLNCTLTMLLKVYLCVTAAAVNRV